MTQLGLLAAPAPPPVPGVDLRCCDVAALLADPAVRGARLVIADPPWCYHDQPGVANPQDATGGTVYGTLSDAAIARHLDLAYDCAAPAARLVVWYTWPKDAEWSAAGGAGPRWGPRVTGGAWLKTAHVGVGYHWRGHSEPVAVFTRGATGRPREMLANGYAGPAGEHSEKPLAWLRAWVRAWTDPGDLVLDLYAGLAPMARACAAEGRRYVGAEVDPERHRAALDRLALMGRRP